MESWRCHRREEQQKSVKTRQNVCKCEVGIIVKSYSVYETGVRPAMMHGFETVALIRRPEAQLDMAEEHKMFVGNNQDGQD